MLGGCAPGNPMPEWPKKKPRPGIDRYGHTPLWHRAFKGDLEGVRSAIKAGADPNIADDVGYTPLHIAAQERHPDVVDLLLQLGADPNRADKHGDGPLWTAVYWANRRDRTCANLAIVASLLRFGANPDHKNAVGRTPREFATIGGDDQVKSLLGIEKQAG